MLTIKVQGTRKSGRTKTMHEILHILTAKGYTVVSPVETNSEGNETVNIELPNLGMDPDFLLTKPKPLTAIEEATKVIYGEREQTYGDPGKNLRTIASYWTTHLKAAKSFEGVLTADDVWVMMSLLKAARLANSPKHRDSIVDLIGYAALGDRINVAESQY